MAQRIEGSTVTFIHVPKTGGIWACKAMEAAGLKLKRFGHEHGTFRQLEVEEMTMNGLLPLRLGWRIMRGMRRFGFERLPRRRFCFVRHPLKWYESFWRYKMDLGWEEWGRENRAAYWHPNAVLNDVADDDFNGFMEKILYKRPGYASEMLLAFANASVDWVGKNENLADDLAVILKDAGLIFDEQALRGNPRANESKTKREKIQWDPDLRETAMRCELVSLLHFGYLSEEEAKSMGVRTVVGRHRGLVS